MDHETEVIRGQMRQTRTALAQKLETLECQVTGTVQQARVAVTDTVETVRGAVEQTVGFAKDSVHETVETVKDTLNLNLQTRRHPWAVMSGAFTVGFIGGYVFPMEPIRSMRRAGAALRPSREPHNGPVRPLSEETSFAPRLRPAEAIAPNDHPEPRRASAFGGEIAKLRGLAIGATLGLLRDFVIENVPENMRPDVRNVMDGFTEKLGGKPQPSPLWRETSAHAAAATGNRFGEHEPYGVR